ncbi:MAG: hypothetical protein NTX52_08505 [Planctomycetota bacterium]|nr:hypothetical protein [Planctomycetota bacterium]
MTRKDIQFIAIRIVVATLVVIDAYLLWPSAKPASGVEITSNEAAEYAYVAYAQREVFLRPDCKWAKRVSPQNMVSFKTREDAMESRRRPCNFCRP